MVTPQQPHKLVYLSHTHAHAPSPSPASSRPSRFKRKLEAIKLDLSKHFVISTPPPPPSAAIAHRQCTLYIIILIDERTKLYTNSNSQKAISANRYRARSPQQLQCRWLPAGIDISIPLTVTVTMGNVNASLRIRDMYVHMEWNASNMYV